MIKVSLLRNEPNKKFRKRKAMSYKNCQETQNQCKYGPQIGQHWDYNDKLNVNIKNLDKIKLKYDV